MARSTPTAVVGTGRLARALLPRLGPAGYRVVTVVSRRPGAARRASRGLAAARATTRLALAAERARVILLAVPDGAIAGLAARLASCRADWSGRVVLHHAGALGPEPLAPLARRGAAVAVLHPLQCFGARHGPDTLRGSRARIEGPPRGRAAAARLARALGLVPLRLPATLAAADRVAYHAAASLVSNDAVALAASAIELFESIGLGRDAALAALAALARGTWAQLERGGPAGALSGPAARGDAATLRAQLAHLARRSRRAAEVHRLLSLQLAELSAGLGRLGPAEARRLRRAVGPRRGRTV